MREQCGRPANQSALMYPAPSHTSLSAANLSLAAFLVTRGPFSYMAADQGTVEGRDRANPFFRLFQLDVGHPLGSCVESGTGRFTRAWSRGVASVDCGAPAGGLPFGTAAHVD